MTESPPPKWKKVALAMRGVGEVYVLAVVLLMAAAVVATQGWIVLLSL